MPAVFHHIRLERAREPDAPEGDRRTGYDLVAALDGEDRLDLEACRAAPERCRVRRFADDETVAVGRLRHTTGDRWILDFGPDESDDETGFRLGEERMTLGEYVSIRAADGALHTYRVVQVEPVRDPAASPA